MQTLQAYFSISQSYQALRTIFFIRQLNFLLLVSVVEFIVNKRFNIVKGRSFHEDL